MISGAIMKLTEFGVKMLPCPAGKKDKLYFDSELRGLAVRVTSSGGRNYLAQFSVSGRKRRIALGACSSITLKSARAAAAKAMGEVAQGRDPATERKDAMVRARREATEKSLTLEALVADWAKHLRKAGRSPKYVDEAVRALKHAFPKRLQTPAVDLTEDAVRYVRRELDEERPGRNGHSTSGIWPRRFRLGARGENDRG